MSRMLITDACYIAQRNMAARLSRAQRVIGLTALALLTERPLHPYQMQRLLRDRHKDYAEGRTRALYRAIEEMEASGWIELAETTREGRRPERTVYRITPEGREVLSDWLADLLERPVREHLVFTAAVGLLAYMSQERALSALQARVLSLRAELAARDEAGLVLEQELRLPRIVLLEHEHERVLREAELRWVVSLVDDIRSGRLRWNEEMLRAQFQALAEDAIGRPTHHGSHSAAAPPAGEPQP